MLLWRRENQSPEYKSNLSEGPDYLTKVVGLFYGQVLVSVRLKHIRKVIRPKFLFNKKAILTQVDARASMFLIANSDQKNTFKLLLFYLRRISYYARTSFHRACKSLGNVA